MNYYNYLFICLIVFSYAQSDSMNVAQANNASISNSPRKPSSPKKVPVTPHTSPHKSVNWPVRSPRLMTNVCRKLTFLSSIENSIDEGTHYPFNLSISTTNNNELAVYDQSFTTGKETYSLFDESSSDEETPTPTEYLIKQIKAEEKKAQLLKADEMAEAIKGGRNYAKKIKNQWRLSAQMNAATNHSFTQPISSKFSVTNSQSDESSTSDSN